MFKAFFSLSKLPFDKESESAEFFASTCFKEAFARLEYLKSTRGIGVITGDPGSGKTSLLRSFAKSLPANLFKPVYFALSTVTVLDFYRGLAYGFGEQPKFRKIDLFAQIQSAIISLYSEKRITPIIFLDEMHLASNQFLTDICLLFNFAMDSLNPFVLVLTGLPHFADKLKLTHNLPLRQRIVSKFQLVPLNYDETTDYINHRMKLAGANQDVFTPAAISAIASNSRGLIREINSLATNSLIAAAQMKSNLVDKEAVYSAVSDLAI